jgi:uncharacterized protein
MMHLPINSDTRISALGPLHFEERDQHTLVVSPATGGWAVVEDPTIIAFLRRLGAGQTDTVVDLESGATQAPVPRATVVELFKRGLLMLDGIGCGTSSSRVENVQIITPKSAHNQYPVLGVMHVHNWCNLACTYCYTIEEGVKRQQLSRPLMLKAVDELVALPTPFTSLEFHGGEPTMAIADIRAVTEYARRVYAEADKRLFLSIQTNGFHLSEAVCDFLADNNFSVRVSLDGTPEMHDEFRVDHRGKGSYRGVVAGIRRLQDRGVAVHAVCVVHSGNADRIVDMYESMAALDVASIRLIPVFQTGKAGQEDWLTGERYFEAYFKAVQHLVDKRRRGEKVVPLPNLVAGEIGSLRSFRREYMCMRNPCGAGVNMIAVDTNGDLYPCEEMIGKQEFVIGNLADTTIKDAIDSSPVITQLRDRHVEEIEECSTCTWKQLCHGGCVHKSYTHFKRLDRESEHCSYYKKIYRELIWLEIKQPGSWDLLATAAK